MTEANDVYYVVVENARLAYRRLGNGPAILVAFHGFGQTGQVFAALGETLGTRYTIIAVDLFFHGDSQYTHPSLLTKEGWQKLMNAFFYAQQIDRFSLLGFSLGGRFALTTMEGFAHRIDQLVLVAPDGITPNPWYWLATRTDTGRWLFRYVLTHLSLLTRAGHALTRFGLLNRTVLRFAEISLSTSQQRELVYTAWTKFRLIQPDLRLIGQLLNDIPVDVQFFTGVFDRLVPGNYILPLAQQLRRYQLTILKTGHNHLIELAAEKIMQAPK